jgi:hypothetical protein
MKAKKLSVRITRIFRLASSVSLAIPMREGAGSEEEHLPPEDSTL